jgi:hypothetical protein
MMKALSRIMVGIGLVTLVFGTPPAYAIFGIRAARKVIAARKAANKLSSPEAEGKDSLAKDGSVEPSSQGNQTVEL